MKPIKGINTLSLHLVLKSRLVVHVKACNGSLSIGEKNNSLLINSKINAKENMPRVKRLDLQFHITNCCKKSINKLITGMLG